MKKKASSFREPPNPGAPRLASETWENSQSRPSRSKPSRTIPYTFVLEALTPLEPELRPMFGSHALYIGDKIHLMLRDRPTHPYDNGLWLVFAETIGAKEFDPATHLKSLQREFPSLRPIQVLNGVIRHWLLLPADSSTFETEALHACDLILAHDPRLGRIPKSRQR